MSCPSAIGVRSTSIGAPAAIVEASGFIWETNGQSVARPPTVATAPVATKRKSRRVGWSAVVAAVVTIPNPFPSCLAAAGGTAPDGARKHEPAATILGGCRRPRPPRRQTDHFSPPIRRKNSSPESFYWHPCRTSASPLSARRRAMHEIRAERCFVHAISAGTPLDADRAFSTRHPPEHRHDPAPVRLPGGGRPHHRTRRLCGVRPHLPPGRHGLSRPGVADAPRLLGKIRGMARRSGLPALAFHHQGGH